MDVPMYQEAIAHYFSGVAISFGDRMFSKNAKKHTERRMGDKLKGVEALQYLTEVGLNTEAEIRTAMTTKEYRDAIRNAREYFRSNSVDVGREPNRGVRGLAAKIPELIAQYKDSERINPLSIRRKLAAAFGLEFLLDASVAVSQVFWGKGNAITAIGESLYQGPCMFAGFATGRGLLYIKDGLFRSKEEKELDKIAKELTKDGRLLEIVKGYSPTEKVKVIEGKIVESKPIAMLKEPQEIATNTDGGDRPSILEKVAGTVNERIGKLRSSIEERKRRKAEEEEKRRTELRSKYDRY